jgi:hypothetical protein
MQLLLTSSMPSCCIQTHILLLLLQHELWQLTAAGPGTLHRELPHQTGLAH